MIKQDTYNKNRKIITPLPRKKGEKQDKKLEKNYLVIVPELCKSCGICIEFCPTKVLEFSKERSKNGLFYASVAHPEKCTQCKLCQLRCPEFAIYLVKTKLKKRKKK
ncbi:MAG: 4Fe-4S dicluster domain-containing protein [Candidatus Ranarchaeia archaeon]